MVGSLNDIKWRHWGSPRAIGLGLTPANKPSGGLYQKQVKARLRASNVGQCSPGGPSAYRVLWEQQQTRPGGTRWTPWHHWLYLRTVCKQAYAFPPAAAARTITATTHHCPTPKQLYEGLPRAKKAYVARIDGLRYGISSIKCAGRWAAAGIALGSDGNINAEALLEHRVHGRWHEVDRDRPCRLHRVPAKIYVYACDGS